MLSLADWGRHRSEICLGDRPATEIYGVENDLGGKKVYGLRHKLSPSDAANHRGRIIEAAMRVPTSAILHDLMRGAPADVTLEWMVANLRERSFGIVMLLIAIVGLVPGLSPVVGIMLAIPAVQMVLGRREPALPLRLASRKFSKAKVERLLHRVIPVLRCLEQIVRPRWERLFEKAERIVGVMMLLLGGTLLAPVPLSNIVPALVIMLLAFSLLEKDGVLLVIALTAALVSLAITAATIWGAIEVSAL